MVLRYRIRDQLEEKCMKRKRIAALMLTVFMTLNEAVYPVNQYVTYAQSEDEVSV